jgi:hypothetical protein
MVSELRGGVDLIHKNNPIKLNTFYIPIDAIIAIKKS